MPLHHALRSRSPLPGLLVGGMIAGWATSAAGQTIWAMDNLAETNRGGVGDALITFDAASPRFSVVEIGRTGVAGAVFGGLDFDCAGNLWGYVQSPAPGGLYRIDTATGHATFIGSGGVPAEQGITDLAYDHDTGVMYGIAADTDFSQPDFTFYRIDLDTGFATTLATLSTEGQPVIQTGLAIDAEGTRYAQDVVQDLYFTWSEGDLVATPLGAQGFDANFSQGCTIDRTGSGILYHGAFNRTTYRTELWTIDTTTGRGTFVGNIGPFNSSTLLPEHETGDLAIEPACPDDLVAEYDGTCPGTATVTVTGATPGRPVALLVAAEPGSVTIPDGLTCGGTRLGLGSADLRVAASRPADASGRVRFEGAVSAAACGRFIQALDTASCRTSATGRIR